MSKWARQVHRWLSMAFTAGVVVNVAAAAGDEEPAVWVYFLAGIPLVLLLVTGLYLFMLPYVAKSRGAQHTAE